MFLRASIRKKDGKVHRYFSVVENKRVGRGRVDLPPQRPPKITATLAPPPNLL
jgi:hypothetical protein